MAKVSVRLMPLAIMVCAGFLVTGCSQMGGQSKNNWEQLTASRTVAKVSNISNLIQPGMN